MTTRIDTRPSPGPQRGEIWLIHFDPSVGDEIRKLRRAVVLSLNQIGRLQLRIVVPVTGWDDAYEERPWMVPLEPSRRNGLTKPSAADGFQVKSVSLERFARRVGHLEEPWLEEIAAAVALCVGFSR